MKSYILFNFLNGQGIFTISAFMIVKLMNEIISFWPPFYKFDQQGVIFFRGIFSQTKEVSRQLCHSLKKLDEQKIDE